MIKIENTDVYGWEAAIRGMRSPMNSWDKSDSHQGCHLNNCDDCDEINWRDCHCYDSIFKIGANDLRLMKSLAKAGSDHGKFLRMINVTVDLTAPLYWWKEFDTYKVGTVANSCSTMHKIQAKEFTLDDFSCEYLLKTDIRSTGEVRVLTPMSVLELTIDTLNFYRKEFLATKDKGDWWQMIQLLPSSYNQRRTVQMNYQVLKNMYHARKNHKLDEWREFCKWCESLPYFKEICIQE